MKVIRELPVFKILLVILIILAFLLLAFAIVKYLPKAFSSLAGTGSSLLEENGKDPAIAVSTSASSLVSGQSFLVSWEDDIDREGVYTIDYGCAESFYFSLNLGEKEQRLICNMPFKLGPDANQAELTAVLEKENTFVDVPIKIAFFKTDAISPFATGKVTITVRDADAPENTEPDTKNNADDDSDTPSADTGYNGSYATDSPTSDSGTSYNSASYGNTYTGSNAPARNIPVRETTGPLADLAMGRVVPIVGTHSATFTVRNIGSQATGTWYFTYTTPDSFPQTLTSPAQPSIAPGQGRKVFITYNGVDFTNDNITVVLDPYNTVIENNEFNNTGSTFLFSY